MAKRKGLTPKFKRTSATEESEKRRESLEEMLQRYEELPKFVLSRRGYKTEKGIWRKGYDADALAGSLCRGINIPDYQGFKSDYQQLKRIVKMAVLVLSSIRKCREYAMLEKLEDAVIEMENIVFMSEILLKTLGKSVGGQKPKSIGAITEAITELYEDGCKTAHQMWMRLRGLTLTRGTYITASGKYIVFESERIGDARSGYLYEERDDGVSRSITFKSFQKYVTAAKKNLRK